MGNNQTLIKCFNVFLGVEACIKRFLDSAKSLEADFLRKQMYSRVNHPQEVTKEVIIDYLQLQYCFELDTLAQCISQFQLRPFPVPPGPLWGICLPWQSWGCGISKFCMAQGSGIRLFRGQPRAFDMHMVSHPNITKMEDFIGNTSRLADWLMYQRGTKNLQRFLKARSSILCMPFFIAYQDRT